MSLTTINHVNFSFFQQILFLQLDLALRELVVWFLQVVLIADKYGLHAVEQCLALQNAVCRPHYLRSDQDLPGPQIAVQAVYVCEVCVLFLLDRKLIFEFLVYLQKKLHVIRVFVLPKQPQRGLLAVS